MNATGTSTSQRSTNDAAGTRKRPFDVGTTPSTAPAKKKQVTKSSNAGITPSTASTKKKHAATRSGQNRMIRAGSAATKNLLIRLRKTPSLSGRGLKSTKITWPDSLEEEALLIKEYLVKVNKRRAFWSLNEDILKITILKTNTPYPSRRYGVSVPELTKDHEGNKPNTPYPEEGYTPYRRYSM
ncbi:hypothetical protein Tco_1189114 [Tanacetum coccineum]